MMKLLCIISAILAVTLAAKRYDGFQVIEVVPQDIYQLQLLQQLMMGHEELDFWLEPSTIGAKTHIMVSPELFAELSWTLELKGMLVKIISDDVQVQIDDEFERLFNRPEIRAFDYNEFNRYDDFMTELDNLAASCSDGFTCATGIAGQSSEGRDLKYITINTGGEGKPTFMIDSLTHAREWLSSATVFNIIRILLDQHPDYSDGRAYAERYNWVILPLVNPDGYEFSHTDERLWRKSRKDNPESPCVGTDLNRNYEYEWGTGGSSGNPCSDTYMGNSAADNSEVVAVQDLAQSVQPWAYLSFHTYGEYWLEPFGSGEYPDNDAAHSAVTGATCDAIQGTFNEAIWRCGNSADVLYGTSGTTADYMRGAVDACKFSWTPELRGPGFIVDPIQIAPSTEEIWNGLKAKMDHPLFTQ